jgi:hypothetical protein
MRSLKLAAMVFAAGCQISATQEVPEGIHSEARGPSEMCGLVGRDAPDLLAQAKASSDLTQVPIETERFVLFANADHSYQLVATTASEAAYPAVSCRHTYEQDGRMRLRRSLRCDAGRAVCDALFLEFQALDAEMAQDIRGGG